VHNRDVQSPSPRPAQPDRDDESEARDIVMPLPDGAGDQIAKLTRRVAAEGWEAVFGPLPLDQDDN